MMKQSGSIVGERCVRKEPFSCSLTLPCLSKHYVLSDNNKNTPIKSIQHILTPSFLRFVLENWQSINIPSSALYVFCAEFW